MRYFRQLLILVLMVFPVRAFSQQYQLSFNKPGKDKVMSGAFLGTDSKGYIYMEGWKTNLRVLVPLLAINYFDYTIHRYVKKYDSALNFIENKRIMAGDANEQLDAYFRNLSLPFITLFRAKGLQRTGFLLNDMYYVMVPDLKSNSRCYKLLAIEHSTGMVAQSYTALKLPGLEEDGEVTAFNAKLSPDSSYLMLMAAYKKEKGKKSPVIYAASVLSRDFREVWSTHYTLPKTAQSFSFQDAVLTNKAEIIMLGRNYNKKSKGNTGYLSVFSMGKESPKPKETRLSFGGDHVEDVFLSMNSGDYPLIIGFYKNQKGKKGIDGIYYANLNADKSVFNVRKKPFTQDFITVTYTNKERRSSDRKARRKNDAVAEGDFSFTDFVRDDSGGFVAIAEEYRHEVVTNFSQNSRGVATSQMEDYDIYGDLIVVRFNASGEIVSLNRIAKYNRYHTLPVTFDVNQGSIKNSNNRDYAFFFINNKIFLMFNGDIGQEDNKHHKRKLSAGLATDTYVVAIGADGSLNRQTAIASGTMGKYLFDPKRDILKIAPNKIAFFARKQSPLSRKALLGTITVN